MFRRISANGAGGLSSNPNPVTANLAELSICGRTSAAIVKDGRAYSEQSTVFEGTVNGMQTRPPRAQISESSRNERKKNFGKNLPKNLPKPTFRPALISSHQDNALKTLTCMVSPAGFEPATY